MTALTITAATLALFLLALVVGGLYAIVGNLEELVAIEHARERRAAELAADVIPITKGPHR